MLVKLDENNVIVAIDIPLSEEHEKSILENDTSKIKLDTDIEPIELMGNYKLEKDGLIKLEQIDICPEEIKSNEILLKENEQLWDTVRFLLKQVELIPNEVV